MKPKTPQAIDDCYQLLLWIIPLLDQFPRNRKFSLGSRLEGSLLDVLNDLLKARWKSNKHQSLSSANSNLDMARQLWRLCHDLQIISTKRYEHGICVWLTVTTTWGFDPAEQQSVVVIAIVVQKQNHQRSGR